MNFTEKLKEGFEKLSHELKQERDEIKVKAHLFSMSAKEEWEELEKKYEFFKANKMPEIKDSAMKMGDDLNQKMKMAGDEIKKGYQKIKDNMDNEPKNEKEHSDTEKDDDDTQ